MQRLILPLRNGAILATLAASPIVIGFLWNAAWGERGAVTASTYAAMVFAWIAATGVVAATALNAQSDGNTIAWFYPCTRCGNRVAIISYRCLHCKSKFTPPPEANAFRNALLLGVAVFYGTFTIGVFLLPRVF